MNLAAIIHEQNRRYIYPEARDRMHFRVRTAKNDIKSCKIHVWSRYDPIYIKNKTLDLKCIYRDKHHDYFEVSIPFENIVSYLRYVFELNDGENTVYLSASGFSQEKPENEFFEYLYANEGDLYHLPKWAKEQIIYQIFPERFFNGNTKNDPKETVPWNSKPTRDNFMGGDLKGIIAKVSYLKSLGITCLYLNPIFESPSNHKYDTTDYFKIDPAFGTEEDFIKLVSICHQEGIKVILDGVFNHCGVTFSYFQDVIQKGKDSCYKDWFYFEGFPIRQDPLNYECVGYYPAMPKMNLYNKPTADFAISVMKYWIEKANIDGWRMDVADEVDYRFWQRVRLELKKEYPECFLLAETWKDGSTMLMGDQFDSVMNYLFRDAIVDFLAKSKIDAQEFDYKINSMLAAYGSHVYPYLYNLIGSHDTARFLRESKEDMARLKLAVAFQMTFPGIPAIYYGDEVGLTGDNDPDCRKAMQWEESLQDMELLNWYKRLIQLRKTHLPLIEGNFISNLCVPEKGLYGFCRSYKDESIYVVINNSPSTHNAFVPVIQDKGLLKELLACEDTDIEIRALDNKSVYYNQDLIAYGGMAEVKLPPRSIKILK